MTERRFLRRLTEPRRGDLDPRLDAVRDHCLDRRGATEDFPFGPEVMVFKVGGKIFAAMAWEESPLTISLKCDPDRAAALREEHAAINPPRYFDKRSWNAVTLDASIDDALLQELVEHSWGLVFASLTRKRQAEIGG
jgi:predicted DNA-binding protein (MmcQ/YjbR family)